MLLHVSKQCRQLCPCKQSQRQQTIPAPTIIPVQTASGLHVTCCSFNARPTPCRRKLEEWSDGDSRELHLEVSPGEERTLEALVRFCYTKQIPFNRGGLLHREARGGGPYRKVGRTGRWAAQEDWPATGRWAAQGGCCTGRWAAQGGCCTERRAAQGATGGSAGARAVLGPALGTAWLHARQSHSRVAVQILARLWLGRLSKTAAQAQAEKGWQGSALCVASSAQGLHAKLHLQELSGPG